MIMNKEHNKQMFSVLLLRELKELQEKESILTSSLSKLEAQLANRNTDSTRREVVETGSETHTAEHGSPTVGMVAEPLASLFGACGTCGHYPTIQDNDPQSPQHESADPIVGRKFVIKVEAAEQPPAENKYCFLCEDKNSNSGCPVCAFIRDQTEDNAIIFATAIQKEMEKSSSDTSADGGSDKEC